MSLPKPNCSFVIPSIHDALELDCRIYYPRRTEQSFPLFGKSFAIFAHPYAPLGGSYDDPVVALCGSVLLQHGCFLVTFNFRGAAGSLGRTSWSGKPELGDYVSVYGFLLCYIDAVCRPVVQKGQGAPILILGGYSYGSMITSYLPSIDIVADLFKSPAPGSAESEIRLRAEDLSRDSRAYLDMHSAGVALTLPRTRSGPENDELKLSRGVTVGGYESDAASRRVSRESSRRSIDGDKFRQSIDRVRRKLSSRVINPFESEAQPPPGATTFPILPQLAYLLVSPLLPPIAGFITMFSKLRFIRKDREIAPPPGKEFHDLTIHPCYCLYGGKDIFTSDRKLQRWAEDLSSRPGSQFVAVRADTGHFWQEAEAIVRLRQGLADWLKLLTSKPGDFETKVSADAGARWSIHGSTKPGSLNPPE
ncbi:uncharacterized protein Z518_02193 [Rhinocladiella mackenziei CBS 650.93]|uniref:Rhinocladiella mackenziei CBS 650.93 unplaced genomic scaffold supercont1.2, whole genome shotgun sequence n=1 Tax=Rhinocladiella mackenziei CBS 650.93 TaxID=1442369 RepID=A0A0D2JEF7_9EURO|nr:uncharacterized protein Z518_02193 [Rhinocladiella mackenziei CBS 650.93]KIX07540.1 hypothetical protein Z518_02193 [Rhinocladiella mackenziei CBS 650.93]